MHPIHPLHFSKHRKLYTREAKSDGLHSLPPRPLGDRFETPVEVKQLACRSEGADYDVFSVRYEEQNEQPRPWPRRPSASLSCFPFIWWWMNPWVSASAIWPATTPWPIHWRCSRPRT